MLDQARVRMLLFAGFALVLALVFVWSLGQGGETSESTTPVPDLTASATPLPSPTLAPSGGASPSPSTSSPVFAKWTPQDVVAYLKAFNTRNWQESRTSLVDRLVAAGAVPGSRAGGSSFSEEAAAQCDVRHCSSEFVSADKIRAGEAGEVNATALVRSTDQGETTTEALTCALTLAAGADTERGLFTDAFCLGPNG